MKNHPVSRSKVHNPAESKMDESGGKTLQPPAFSLAAEPASNQASQSVQLKAAPQRIAQMYGGGAGGSTNPNAIIPIADLIRYIRDVEAAYPEDTPRMTLTRIRQQYYEGIGFSMLIPNSPSTVVAPRDTSVPGMTPDYVNRKLGQGHLPQETWTHLTAKADENGKADNPSPYILLGNGERIDLGHLLLGMDARVNYETGIPFTTFGVPNIDPSTWVADVGIAAAWTEIHEITKSPPDYAPRKLDRPDLDEYYKMSAPTEDLLGDVDSFRMGDVARNNAGLPLSAIFEQYYLGKKGSKPEVDKRWQTFCQLNHFGRISGAKFIWNPNRAALITRINNFNNLFGSGNVGAMMATVTGPKEKKWKYTEAVLQRFLTFVKTRLDAEMAGHSGR